MKSKLIIIVAALLVTIAAVAQKRRVVETPLFESANTSSIEFTRVEVNKEATVVSATIWQRHGYWVIINSSSVLKGRTTGRDYKFLRAEGVEVDKEVVMPESNRIDCTLYFEPVGNEDTSVDFRENIEEEQNSWEINGISLLPLPSFLQGSWEPVGNAGNVVAAFVQDRLLYDGEAWKYTATQKGRNITLDITCGGITQQLLAVPKSDGTLLLKKDKKDKGTLLTRKAQTAGNDGYAYNPARATPLFFRSGKVVLKGCVINNLTTTEQQNFMKIIKYNNVLSISGNELVRINRDGTFQCEFEVDHPHYVYMQSPLNTMVFVVPGDTVVMCYDAVESDREYYSNCAPAVLGNSLSAQLTRYSMPCKGILENSIEGVKECSEYNRNHSATKESALAFVDKAAPLFKAIYEKAPSLLATLPLSPVAKDIIITNVAENLFSNIFDVDMFYNEKAYIKGENDVWEENENFVPLSSVGYYSFLNDSVNARNLLDNDYFLCNRNNWVIFNRLAFRLLHSYCSRIYLARNEFEEEPCVKKLATLPENADNEDFKNALGLLKYGNHYTGKYNAKVAELARNLPFDSLPDKNYIYGNAFKDIEKELGIGNCMMLQQAIFEIANLEENNLDYTMEVVACTMPFITNPVVAGQLVNKLRKIVAEREGGAERKMTPEVARFLKSLNEKYPGEVIILDFWGLGCGPCRSEMLRHRELVEKYAGKVRFVYISVAQNNTEAAVNEFFTTNNIKGENLRVSGDTWAYLSSHFNFSGIPHVEILLKDGTLYPNSYRLYLNDEFIENFLLKE